MREKIAKTPEQALETLRWLCAKMERCESDAVRSLYRWGVEKQHHREILDKLVAEKFIDQNRYARGYISEKLAAGNWGRSKIAYALNAKGIEKEIIESTLQELIKPGQMSSTLERSLRQKYKKECITGKTPWEIRTRLVRWASARGFEYDQIINIITEITHIDEDEI
ncbi:MAG: regulatory protein RecX [Mucinivorans sp.]